MPLELSLTFPTADQVVVVLHHEDGGEDSPPQRFASPLDQTAREDLTWHLESYPIHYTTELDDQRAARIAAKLKDWGGALFSAVFDSRPAGRLFNKFQESGKVRLITVSTLHPSVLAHPWELLCDPDGTFLFLDFPTHPNPPPTFRHRTCAIPPEA